MIATETVKSRRVDLILRQIDSLPTLPAIATRLLALTTSSESSTREVVDTVSSDPALTAKVLALCKRADLGIREEVMSIERAVVLVGFNAVRNAVLSIKVFEVFGPDADDDADTSRLPAELRSSRFNRTEFWRHCLGVAAAAELLCTAHPREADLNASEAFVCGLMHDIGKLSLDFALPKSYARVVQLTDLNQGNISELERRVIGLDHQTAGKRIAEQWSMPRSVQETIWLHGTPMSMLPKTDNRRMIGLITLADLIVRQQHIGYSGNFNLKDNIYTLADELELKRESITRTLEKLHQEVAWRSHALGLDENPSPQLFLESIQRANEALGRLNGALDRRSRTAARQSDILKAIRAFHATAGPGVSLPDMLQRVATSAASVLDSQFFALLLQPDKHEGVGDRDWLITQFDAEGSPTSSDYVTRPRSFRDLSQLDPSAVDSIGMMKLAPWLAEHLLHASDIRDLRVLALNCGEGAHAVLVHDAEKLPPDGELAPLTATWGAALASAAAQDSARQLGEELANANRALVEAQDRLLRSESLARLGEMAAGAAHEMNNPLAVISGRSQLLVKTLHPGGREHQTAQIIFQQANRLSDLITSMRLFADPPRADRRACEVGRLLVDVVDHTRTEMKIEPDKLNVGLQIKGELPELMLDRDQVSECVREILLNAMQSAPRSGVTVTAMVNKVDRSLIIQVIDDGRGMDAHTLDHAMDPFFSAKQAGRRVGLGLARAQQLAAGHGGCIDLRSSQGMGTTATLTIPLDLD